MEKILNINIKCKKKETKQILQKSMGGFLYVLMGMGEKRQQSQEICMTM